MSVKETTPGAKTSSINPDAYLATNAAPADKEGVGKDLPCHFMANKETLIMKKQEKAADNSDNNKSNSTKTAIPELKVTGNDGEIELKVYKSIETVKEAIHDMAISNISRLSPGAIEQDKQDLVENNKACTFTLPMSAEEGEFEASAMYEGFANKDEQDEAMKTRVELVSLTDSLLDDVSARSSSADLIGSGVPRPTNNNLQIDLDTQDDIWETTSVGSFGVNNILIYSL